MPDLRTLEKSIGHRFRRAGLLLQAVTQRSYASDHPEQTIESHERLALLGDTLWDFLVMDHLYRRHPDKNEALLTPMRDSIVKKKTLAEIARGLRLGQYLRLGTGQDRNNDRILAECFEAVIGAVYLDGGLKSAQRVATRLLARPRKSRRWPPGQVNP